VIPTRPGILDLRAIGASVEIANLAKRRAVLGLQPVTEPNPQQ
jgi:hypothetical protein